MTRWLRKLSQLAAGAALLMCAHTATAVPLQLLELHESSQSDRPMACAVFSERLNPIKSKQMSYLVSIEEKGVPHNDYVTLSSDGNRICASNLKYSTDYSLFFSKEISAYSGLTLVEDHRFSFTTAAAPREIALLDSTMRPPRFMMNFTLHVINVPAVRLAVFRVGDSALRNNLMQHEYQSAIGTEKAVRLIRSSEGAPVDSQIFKTGAANGLPSRMTVTLSRGDSGEGSLLVIACDPMMDFDAAVRNGFRGDEFRVWAARVIPARTLSLYLRRHDASLEVDVHAAGNAMPIQGAKVSLYTINDVFVASQNTDKLGHARFNGLLEEKDSRRAYRVVAESEQGFGSALIPKKDPPSHYCDNQKLGCNSGIMAFLDRQTFAPGETVQYVALSRGSDLAARNVEGFTLQLISPYGAVVREEKIVDKGGASFDRNYRLPEDAPEGRWELRVLDGKDEVISEKFFTVIPPRYTDFKIMGPEPNHKLLPSDDEFLSLNAIYKQGSPAAELFVNASVLYRPQRFPFESFPDFAVGPDLEADAGSLDLRSDIFPMARTDESGGVSFNLKTPDMCYPLDAVFSAVFSDKYGNHESYVRKYPVKASENVAGVRVRRTSDSRIVTIKVFSPAGRPVAGRVYYRLFKINPSGVYRSSNSGWRYRNRQMRELLTAGMLDVNPQDDSTGRVPVPLAGGEYRIEAVTAGGVVTSMNFTSDYTRANLFEGRLKLNIPANLSFPGDPASVSFESPYDGNAIVEVDSASGIQRFFMQVREGANRFELTMAKEFGTFARLRLIAFYPQQGQRILRAVGEGTLRIRRPDAEIEPVLGFSKDPVPGQKFPIGISAQGSSGKAYYSIMAQLRKHRDTTRHELLSDPSDNSYTVETFYNSGPQSGDFSRGYFYLPIPNEEGTLMLNLIVWDENGTGQTVREFELVKPTSATLEAPGDLNLTDTVLTTLHVRNNLNRKNYQVNVTCPGKLSCSLKSEFTLMRGESTDIIIPVTASEIGAGKMHVEIMAEHEMLELNRDIQVKLPFPLMGHTRMIKLAPGEHAVYTIPEENGNITAATLDMGPVPYLNRESFNQMLAKAAYTSRLERLYALVALLDADYVTAPDSTRMLDSVFAARARSQASRQWVQQNLDDVSASVTSSGSILLKGRDLHQRNLITIKATEFLYSGRQHGFTVHDDVMAALLGETTKIASGIGTPFEQVLAQWVMMKAGLITQALLLSRNLYAATGNGITIRSPAALGLISMMLYKANDNRSAQQALGQAAKRLKESLAIRGRLSALKKDELPITYLSQLQDLQEPDFTSPSYDAAMLLVASACLGNDEHFELIDSVLSKCSETLDTQVYTLAALTNIRSYVDHSQLTNKTLSPSSREVEVRNAGTRTQYATISAATVHDAGTAPVFQDDNDLFHVRMYILPENEENGRLNATLKKNGYAMFLLDIESKETPQTGMRFIMPTVPGIMIDHLLTDDDPRFPHVDKLYPLTDSRVYDNYMVVHVGKDRGRHFRMGAIVKAVYSGVFVIPSPRLCDESGFSKLIAPRTMTYLRIN